MNNLERLPDFSRQITLTYVPKKYAHYVITSINTRIKLSLWEKIVLFFRIRFGLPVVFRAATSTDEMDKIFNYLELAFKKSRGYIQRENISPYEVPMVLKYQHFLLTRFRRKELIARNPSKYHKLKGGIILGPKTFKAQVTGVVIIYSFPLHKYLIQRIKDM